MNKLTTLLLLTGLALIPQVQANNSLNTLSSTYDIQARSQMSENDVKSFVYQWFAAFDHQLESGYFLNRVSEQVEMQYPDFPIQSKQDFLRWYQGVTDNIVWNGHTIKEMTVKGDQSSGWDVSYDVNWKARSKDNQQYDVMVHQELKIIRVGDMLKLTKLDAEIIK